MQQKSKLALRRDGQDLRAASCVHKADEMAVLCVLRAQALCAGCEPTSSCHGDATATYGPYMVYAASPWDAASAQGVACNIQVQMKQLMGSWGPVVLLGLELCDAG